MFESTYFPAPICERCGHNDSYHTTTYCSRTEGGYGKTMEQRRTCDCPGWKRDLLWSPWAEPASESAMTGTPE